MAAIVPLALFLSQAFSLVSFPFTNLFLTLSFFLLVGLLKLERDRQESQQACMYRRSHDLSSLASQTLARVWLARL